MTNAVVPVNSSVSAVMARYVQQQQQAVSDLGAGVTGGFAILSYRGKVWSIKHRGSETQLMRPDGDGPKQTMDLVIVRASPNISKIYYANGYIPGSTDPPDCFSVNGITPDPASPQKQCNTCAGCPMNAWGSKITEAGKQTKACADSKRLAVVPLDDLGNAAYGGPMLLRVPAASLGDMKTYADKLQSRGFPYFGVGTKIKFDPSESFPKFVFEPYRPLNDAEAEIVIEQHESEHVKRMLSSAVDEVRADVMPVGAAAVTPQGNPAATTAAVATGPTPEQIAAAQAEATAKAKAVQDAANKAAAEAAAAAEAKAREDAIAKAAAEAAAKARAEALAAYQAQEAAKAKAAQDAAAAAAAAAVTPDVTSGGDDGFFTMGKGDDPAPNATATGQGAAVTGVSGVSGTGVAAGASPASTATAAANDVVDAEYKEMETAGAASPEDFDNLLESLLAAPTAPPTA